ncbi:hypothetical protein QJQ45_027294, partial [Haematococcus lacustris]
MLPAARKPHASSTRNTTRVHASCSCGAGLPPHLHVLHQHKMHWPSKPPCIKARHAAAASIADDPIVAHAPTNPDKDLINADFAPTGIRDRHWGALDFATFWITMVISITTWYLAASLVDMGAARDQQQTITPTPTPT